MLNECWFTIFSLTRSFHILLSFSFPLLFLVGTMTNAKKYNTGSKKVHLQLSFHVYKMWKWKEMVSRDSCSPRLFLCCHISWYILSTDCRAFPLARSWAKLQKCRGIHSLSCDPFPLLLKFVLCRFPEVKIDGQGKVCLFGQTCCALNISQETNKQKEDRAVTLWGPHFRSGIFCQCWDDSTKPKTECDHYLACRGKIKWSK